MNRILPLLAFLSLILPLNALEITEDWMIVCSEKAQPVEQQAATETAKYIRAVSGLKLKTAVSGSRKAIIIRKGPYAPDEWHVQAGKDRLIISGGLPNGILYGAYEFIEKGLGVRFLAADAEYIPKKDSLILPDSLLLTGRPFFQGRQIYPGNTRGKQAILNDKITFFSIKRKQTLYYISPAYGMNDRLIDGPGCHTYFRYSRDFPADHPEYHSLDRRGRRLRAENGSGPGQLCLSQPEVRRLTAEKMAEFISKGRKNWDRSFPGLPWPMLIDLSANDNGDRCICPGCLALEKKYGGRYSGAMLDFTNDVALRIQKLYPGTQIQTFAYKYTEDAPLHIKAHPLVMIQIAQLGGEWSGTSGRRDSLRSLDHPGNRRALAQIQEWAASGAALRMWDYWILYNQFLFPRTNISAIAPNIRLYRKYGVTRIFSENEMFNHKGEYSGGNFYELGYYLGSRLMVDPALNEQKLISEFMHLYYGPAAQAMTALLNFLETSMAKEPGNLGAVGIGANYLTRDFFLQSEKLFARAEKLAGGDQAILQRIGQERISFDAAAISLQQKLNLAFKLQEKVDRFKKNNTVVFQRYMGSDLTGHLASLNSRCEALKTRLPLPPRFAGSNAFDFPWYRLTKYPVLEWADDPAAAGGKALKFSGRLLPSQKYDLKKFHEGDLELGLYDADHKEHLLRKIIPRQNVPQDGKYHWYHVGCSRLGLKNTLWLHKSWWFVQNCPDQVYNSLSPDTEYDIHVSLKLEGPAYVPEASGENALYLDRIILVRKP